MKTLIIIVCVLAIMMTVHGFNEERYYKFQMNMCRCSRDRKIYEPETPQQVNATLLKCAFRKDGGVFDQNSRFSLYGTNGILKDIIYDETLLAQAKEIFNKCYTHVSYQKYRYNVDNVDYISHCSASILSFIN